MVGESPAEKRILNIDLDFLNEVKKHGGRDLKKCMQCAECSVICPISPTQNPFPRKEMIWTQWGQSERILTDPDIWMCHNCDDCSKECPRNAKPGSVMASLRSLTIEHYSWPRPLGKLFRKRNFLPIFSLLPIILLLISFYYFGWNLPPNGPVYFSSFVPYNYVDVAGILVGLFALFSLFYGVSRYYKLLTNQKKGNVGFFKAAFLTLKEVISHSWFNKCESNHSRYYAHILLLYGFCALLLATFTGALEIHLFGFSHALLGDPQNIIGNVGTAVILPGIIISIGSRVYSKIPKEDTYFDWYFLLLLLTIVVTGVVIEVLRFADSSFTYWTYLAHLVLVFMLIAYWPYSKFAHVFYRFFAMVYLTSVERRPSSQ